MTIHALELKFSVCYPNILLEESMSQLGHSFYLMSKNGQVLVLFSLNFYIS